MRRARLALLALLLAACAPGATEPATQPAASISLTECALTTPGISGQAEADCGTLAVPEDWENPAGRQIGLRVAVVPSVSRSAEPDPLFILAGGPGQAASENFLPLAGDLAQISQVREIVLVDQRGTGRSNPLRCSSPDADRAELTESREATISRLQSCPARLDADPRLYTTLSAVRDLDAVREALGYTQINLYGISYGTRAALAYLRLYPEHVRAVVLDAVVSPDLVLYQGAPDDGQRALDFLLDRCDADADCAAAFPSLRADLQGIFDELAAGPAQVQMPDPVTAEPLDFPLTREVFASQLFNLLYAPETASLVPLGLHAAAERQDFAPLLGLSFALDDGIYDAMFYAVTCAEDAPLLTGPAAGASLFSDLGSTFREVCAAWPRGPAPVEFRAPADSDAPALLLSGEADPITPPRYAEAVARGLPNSLHVTAPGMGHGVLTRGCIPTLVADFVEQASVAGLNAACVAAITPPPFFLRPTGPNP